MIKSRIYSQKSGALSENDRLELARLLVKAGYTVRIGKEKQPGKSSNTYSYFVEFSEGVSE